ncbi:MAG: hypothetical protein NVS2B9_06010 [Myxococcales bacterium]
MAIQTHFFMSAEDERELFLKFANRDIELYPELTPRGVAPVPLEAAAAAALEGPGYYFALCDVSGYAIKRGHNRGMWKIDEVSSPVIYFARSLLDEDGMLRSGYFWCELMAAGDNSRMGGKPDALRRLINDLQAHVKARFRKSQPVGFFVGPGAARLHDAGTPLREAGRKGGLIVPYR